MTKIERIIPYLMDGLAALAGGIVGTGFLVAAAKAGGWPGHAKTIAVILIVETATAFLAVRIARWSIRDQVHMELAEGGK
jgi:hypothetical protein